MTLTKLNPSSWARTDVVRVFVPSSRVPLDRGFAIQAADGAPVPHAEEPQAGPANRNRPQGRWATFVAEEVPPLGYRRYAVVDGDSIRDDSHHSESVLENEHYRVQLEPREGCAVSIVDKAHERSFGGGLGQQAEHGQAHDEPIRWTSGG